MILLLWLLAGAINFGLGYLAYITLRDAAQEGATYGALNPTDLDGIRNRVQNTAGMSATSHLDTTPQENTVTIVDLSSVTPDVSTPDGICPGNIIKVTVNYPFPLIMPFVDMVIDNPIHLSAHATAEILRKVDQNCPAYTGH